MIGKRLIAITEYEDVEKIGTGYDTPSFTLLKFMAIIW